MKKIPFSPPDITEDEINEVIDTLRSGWLTTGPKTKKFEKLIAKYCTTDKAVCLNSATACMEMTLRVLGVGPGDEVITTAYTYTATASVIHHVGAKIVLVDSQKDSVEIDYDQIEKAITSRTKVIIPVDIGGIMCDYARLKRIAHDKKKIYNPANDIQKKFSRIVILADGAHSFGAKKDGNVSGAAADFTAFSFHAVKNLTTGEGGAVTWLPIQGISDQELYNKYMLLTLHGQSKDALAKTTPGAWEYDIIAPYFKFNMTDIMASIGLIQLKRYPELLKQRKILIEVYKEQLDANKTKILPHYKDGNCSSGHLMIVKLVGKGIEDRNKIIQKMAEKGIATNVHYKPLPLLTAYKDMGFDIKCFPNANGNYQSSITLPLNTKLVTKDVEYICAVLNELL